MCGICGWVGREPADERIQKQVEAMSTALAHRGPDGEGHFRDGPLCLAMRRLSIIDLDGGWQPLYNEDGSLALVYNGEIYNHVELRAQLQAEGHEFRTRSDGETILHLYERDGLDFVHALRGMFALALWDATRRRLVLARDRMGEKPLYLYQTADEILFASELKALLRSGRVPFQLDAAALDQYFHFGYVPEPTTPVRGIRKLDAAHLMVVDVDPWNVSERRYWDMLAAPPVEGDPAGLIRQELERVSEIIVRADVPVGIALSGGLDSGALAALAAGRLRGQLQAFTVGYRGCPACDEREQARWLADRLGIAFHEIELGAEDLIACFKDLALWRDDPLADYAGVGYYAVMRAARAAGVPVMLQGQGGDELFWGYPWVQYAARRAALKDTVLRRGALALPTLIRARPPLDRRPRTVLRWLLRGAGTISGWRDYRAMRSDPPGRVPFYNTERDFMHAASQARTHYHERFRESLDGADACAPFTVPPPWPPVPLMLTELICATFLRENGVTQADRLGMASGVELRLPFLDHRLVELVIGLRKSYPDQALAPKTWLRQAMRGVVPDELFERRKRGFAPPFQEWHEALFGAFGDSLEDGYLVTHEVLSPEAGQTLSRGEFPESTRSPLSYRALVLETWCRGMSDLAAGSPATAAQLFPGAGSEMQ